eukprot:gb/GEZN01014341.1/.p1 GENE.gb/GEZN01014341.1/~~gb/GEZN01014341.1/.p1  ORF type:complete len:248 (-),score=63.22 gb/GEZN01014341.1/:186-929(-)
MDVPVVRVRTSSSQPPSPRIDSPSSFGRQDGVQPLTKCLPKIVLGADRQEKVKYEHLGDLFAIVVTMEHLEKAYVIDAVPDKEYQSQCKKLIAQFKTQQEAVKAEFRGLEQFIQDYHLNCRAAVNRFKTGVPATMVHGSSGDGSLDEKKEKLVVFHAVQHFITCMDSLKLNMKAVDEIHPTLSDLMESINKIQNLPPEHETKAKVRNWLLKLSQRQAQDELTDEEVRQMSFDLESAYNALHRFIESH